MKALFLIVLLNVGLPIGSQAASTLLLDRDVPAALSGARGQGPAHLLRTRTGRVNPAALPGPDAAGGARTELNLFADSALEVEWQRFERHAGGNFGWHGQLLDDPMSAVTLTVVGDATVLHVLSPRHGQFEVRSRGDVRGDVRQFDPEKLKGDGKDFVVESAGFGTNDAVLAEEPVSPAPQGAGVTGVTIDVLMVYSTKAMQLAGGRADIVALCQSAVNGENSNFSRSDISHRMRLVQTLEVSHTTSGNLSTELGWVAGNSTVAAARDAAGADIVAFLSDKDDSGTLGIAYQLTSTSGNSGQAFSANYYDTVGGVWPHEVGHNLGCQHNSAGVYSYSSGHYWANDNGNTYGSLMSYIGIRVPYFSNPDVDHWTGTTGTSSRDNARSVDNIGDNVAGYKTSRTLIEPSCSIAASTAKPREGIDFTLTITTTNGGPSTATACKITVTLPSKLTLVSHNGGTAFNTSTKVWDVPDLADNAIAKLVLTLRPNSGSAGVSQTPKATISSVGTGFVDFNLYNNDGSVTLVPGPAPTTDLVLHYALDETSGRTAYDSSAVEGGAQNATTTNSVPQWQPAGGIIGGALRMTPTAQADVGQAFSYTSSSAILGGYPFTMALWARGTTGAWYQVCAMLGDQTLGSSYYELSLNRIGGSAQLQARNTAQVWASAPSILPVTDDQWHHIAAVFPSATQRILYVDGMPVSTNTTSVGFVASTTRFSIGALMRNSPTQAFPGELDDIGLWSTALAPERIALIHALGRYSAVDLDDSAIGTLLAVHTAQTGFAGAGGVVWIPATGLTGPAGSSGFTNGQPYLVLDAGGRGLIGLTQPALGLSGGLSGDSMSLSWHSGFSDWILQEATDILPADWSDSTLPVDDNGLLQTAECPLLDPDRRYFRLIKP